MTKTFVALCLSASFALVSFTGCGGKSVNAAKPGTLGGFESLMNEIATAQKAGDAATVKAFAATMVVPNYDSWFKKTFGDEAGAKLSADYAKRVGDVETKLPELFASVIAKGQTNIVAGRYETAGDANATGLQNTALAAMKEKTALYSVRFIEPGKDAGMHVWSFAHVDGSFRFIGKLQPLSDGAPQ